MTKDKKIESPYDKIMKQVVGELRWRKVQRYFAHLNQKEK